MKDSKLEYFLNAIHYCLWLNEKKFGNFAGRVVETLLAPIPKYLFTKVYKEKYYKRLPKEQKKVVSFFNNRENGYYIGRANHWFGYLYSSYFVFFSFLLMPFIFKAGGDMHNITTLILLALPVVLGYIPAYKAVFTNDRYLKYFKQFEKEDERWHRKWKRITLVFEIGSIVSIFLGIGAAFFYCDCLISLMHFIQCS